MAEYKTVRKNAQDQFVEKRSRFIGYACPVQTKQEALDFITSKKSEHWDASHNVYAYILRRRQLMPRFSDDGEPAGLRPGMPVRWIAPRRKSEALRMSLRLPMRYLGGILLGGGGLVRAYSHTASIATRAR
ncbi:YigZ family protein [Hominenteromicrobium sp.]|uniref:YigZ family protein n=1 Tax=Hominenteromicrobium sp. TaxID=3073581 RepID=UPI00399C4A67